MDTPEQVDQPHKLEIVIRFNVLRSEFSLEGCDKNPVVALGMLDYALARVRRFLATNDIQHEMQEASRILPGSAFRQ